MQCQQWGHYKYTELTCWTCREIGHVSFTLQHLTTFTSIYSDDVRRQAPTAGYTTSSPDAMSTEENSTPDLLVTGAVPTTRPHCTPQSDNDFVTPKFVRMQKCILTRVHNNKK